MPSNFDRAQQAYDNAEPDDPPDCPTCEGEGKSACDCLEGWRACAKCEGDGQVTADVSRQQGRIDPLLVDCPDCEGHGTVSCDQCDGSGYIECEDCNGTGAKQAPERDPDEDR